MKIRIESPDISIKSVTEESDEVTFKMGAGLTDYEDLLNLPKLNGKTIKGNMKETDPTVPDWAKSESKPEYSADEIGALSKDDEMSYASILEIWQSIFKE